MTKVVNARAIDQIGVENSSRYSAIYFIVFLLVGGLFTINLFQGVVISTYLNEKEKLSNNHHLTDMQREWIKVQIKCLKVKPKITIPNVKHQYRKNLIIWSN